MRLKYIFPVVSVMLLTSCGAESNSENGDDSPEEIVPNTPIPDVSLIDESSSTEFSVVFEEEKTFDKNIVYAPTLGMAWDQIDELLNDEPQDFTNERVALLDLSSTYLNTLSEDEYSADVEVNGNVITAKASFKKTLMFEEPFRVAHSFKWEETGTELRALDFYGYHSQAQLNYYNSDDDFSFSLLPEDQDHEIVLMLAPTDSVRSLQDVYQYLTNEMTEEAMLNRVEWKNEVNDDDYFGVPNFAFNLAYEFEEIIGSTFNTLETTYSFVELYQRNAFVLDETGAIVESEVVASTEDMMAAPPEEVVEPKDMTLDRPFFLFLRKKDKALPYFAVYVNNTDILVVQK